MATTSIVTAFALLSLVLASIALYREALGRKVRTEPGSAEYYAAASQVVLFAAVGCISRLGLGLLFGINGSLFFGGLSTGLGIVWGYLFWKALHDDDWFDNQRQRLGDGLKRLGKRLASRTHAPEPT